MLGKAPCLLIFARLAGYDADTCVTSQAVSSTQPVKCLQMQQSAVLIHAYIVMRVLLVGNDMLEYLSNYFCACITARQ